MEHRTALLLVFPYFLIGSYATRAVCNLDNSGKVYLTFYKQNTLDFRAKPSVEIRQITTMHN